MSPLPNASLARACSLIRPVLSAVGVILLLSLLLASANAIEPLVMKMLIDGLDTRAGEHHLIRAIALLGVLVLGREVVQQVINWLTWRSRLRLHFELLEAVVDRLQNLSVAYHQRQGVGATMTRLDRGIQGFVGAFNEVAFQAAPAAVYLAISTYFMFDLNARLATMVVLVTPLPLIISRTAAPFQARRERRLLTRWAKIYSRFNEVLAGIVTVKSFTQEEQEKRRFLTSVAEANGEVERGVRFDSGVSAAHHLTVAGTRIAALGFGGVLALQGEMTVGTLVAFLGYVSGLFGPLQGLACIYQTVRKAAVSMETLVEILDAQDEVCDPPGARPLLVSKGEVRFDKVSFGYPGRSQAALHRIDLHVPAGQRVAIVGPSGAGKTTLMALLQRFYDPTAGRVLVDGQDVRELQQRSLRRNIGVVLQDALLFDDTIRNNITYGDPTASDHAVSEAARHANAHEMIMRLPQGYDTRVGERGAKLSAGERQRVAIARALLKAPPILILDEATSALDAETERLIQEALERLTAGRTTFIIAHRLSTVVNADRIVVLENGMLIEDGTHATLMKRGGTYASLVASQVSGLLQAG